MCRTEFASKLQDKDIINKLTESKYKKELNKVELVMLNLALNQELFLHQMDEELFNFSDKPGARAKVRDILTKRERLVLIIDNFNFNNIELLKYLITFQQIDYNRVNFIFVTLESDFNNLNKNLEDFGIFYENLVYFEYLNEKELKKWIEVNYENKLSSKAHRNLHKYTGGMIGLVRVVLNNLSSKEIEKSKFSGIKKYTKSVWDRFTTKEQKVLKSIHQNKKSITYPEIAKYMREHKLISNNKITGEWIIEFLEKEKTINLKIDNNNIYWDQLNISQHLSDTNKDLLIEFLGSNNYRLTREELAEFNWGEDWNQKYSDWAIDKMISRLRKELRKIGLNKIIKTKKKVGFELNNINLKD